MICAVVLAAGRSTRMGTQKLLLPFGDMPLIARIVDEVQRGPVDQMFVVVGSDAERIQRALSGRVVIFIKNPDGDGDMLSSIRCGLAALPESCEAVLIVLGDQPGVTGELVAGLIGAFRTSGRGIIVPAHGNQRGHPLLFSARYVNEVLNSFDGVGLRGLLQMHPQDVFQVAVPLAGTLCDMDTPADYESRRNQAPGE